MSHMLTGDNLAIVMPKRVEHVGAWHHAFVSRDMADHVAVSLKTIDYLFPLYLYPMGLFADRQSAERRSNINPRLATALAGAYAREASPEEVLYYVYATLYAPSYRAKYAGFLRMDFPRVPFTTSKLLFEKLAGLGARLTELHLLRSPELEPPASQWPVKQPCTSPGDQ